MVIKAQSAMEYLMTYGWTILIIGVIMAVLFSLGVFNPSGNSSPSVCVAVAGWQCQNIVLYSSGTLSFTTGQIGSTITITGTACTSTNTAPASMQIISNLYLSSGQTATLNATCTISSSTIGTKATGYLWLRYNNQYQNGLITPIGRFVAYVKSAGSGPTFGRIAYVPINVVNAQSSPTSSSFQQLIYFNPSQAAYSANEASDLGNVRFYQGGSELYSWCEMGCNTISTNALFWVVLPSGVAATSNSPVNLTFLTTTTDYDGSYAGEAPQLSSSYAQFDNGANVFNFYDNGNTTSGLSVSQAGSLSVVSQTGPYGPSIKTLAVGGGGVNGQNYQGAMINSALPGNFIAEGWLNIAGNNNGGLEIRAPNTAANNCYGYIMSNGWDSFGAGIQLQTPTSCGGVNNLQATGSIESGWVWMQAYASGSSLSMTLFNQPYGTVFSTATATNTLLPSTNQYIGLTAYGGLSSPAYYAYVRVRQYPPGGVMPSAVFGTMSH